MVMRALPILTELIFSDRVGLIEENKPKNGNSTGNKVVAASRREWEFGMTVDRNGSGRCDPNQSRHRRYASAVMGSVHIMCI